MKILKNEYFLLGVFIGSSFGTVFSFIVASWFGVVVGAVTALVALWFHTMASSERRARGDD